MTFSISTSHGTGLRCLAVLVGSLLLSSCTAGQDARESGAAGPPAPTPTGTSEVGPGKEPTTHDGRTVLPARPEDCSTPGAAGIKDVLGPVAAQIQPPTAKSGAKDGLVDVSCTFGLAPVPAGQAPEPGNSLVVATTTASDDAAFARLELPRLMMAPEPVSGVGSKAWYSVNRLSESTEYVMEIVDGRTVTRISLAVPSASGAIDGVQQKLSAIATLP
jgi:hypothetical protein